MSTPVPRCHEYLNMDICKSSETESAGNQQGCLRVVLGLPIDSLNVEQRLAKKRSEKYEPNARYFPLGISGNPRGW